ncbi:hypothetical protein STEG23_029961, partial [Scotinomys teguina]
DGAVPKPSPSLHSQTNAVQIFLTHIVYSDWKELMDSSEMRAVAASIILGEVTEIPLTLCLCIDWENWLSGRMAQAFLPAAFGRAYVDGIPNILVTPRTSPRPGANFRISLFLTTCSHGIHPPALWAIEYIAVTSISIVDQVLSFQQLFLSLQGQKQNPDVFHG